jgi:hypothetical protein
MRAAKPIDQVQTAGAMRLGVGQLSVRKGGFESVAIK